MYDIIYRYLVRFTCCIVARTTTTTTTRCRCMLYVHTYSLPLHVLLRGSGGLLPRARGILHFWVFCDFYFFLPFLGLPLLRIYSFVLYIYSFVLISVYIYSFVFFLGTFLFSLFLYFLLWSQSLCFSPRTKNERRHGVHWMGCAECRRVERAAYYEEHTHAYNMHHKRSISIISVRLTIFFFFFFSFPCVLHYPEWVSSGVHAESPLPPPTTKNIF